MPSGHDVWVGLFTGLAAAIIWAVFAWLYRRVRLYLNFHHLGGEYRARRKGADHDEPQEVSIKVAKNVLEVTQTFPGEPESRGDVVMNEQMPSSGRGQYARSDDRWGFWEVQARGKHTLLVHETYAHPVTKVAVVSGYVWTRIGH